MSIRFDESDDEKEPDITPASSDDMPEVDDDDFEDDWYDDYGLEDDLITEEEEDE